jgi:voltage-gated potassium channel
MNLRSIVQEDTTKAGRVFDLFVQFLIVLSLVDFSIETLPDLSEEKRFYLKIVETFIVAIFTIEYILRVITSAKKREFIFSFYGIVDLAAILPFYLSTGIDLRSVRIFRLFKLFRLFKILRYSKALNRMKEAFVSVKEELVLFILSTLFLVYIASVGIYYCENKAQPEIYSSVFHSMWWSIVTLTTVGYGDSYPITTLGKVFSSMVMFLGIGLVAVPSGLIASALTKTLNKD